MKATLHIAKTLLKLGHGSLQELGTGNRLWESAFHTKTVHL